MSASHAFVWLNGTISIPSPAPQAWAKEGLTTFYQNPNHPEWGGSLCRVLYHESIHFWQLLSSAYLANALQDEWLRLVEFESTGRMPPVSDFVAQFSVRADAAPFSAQELMECWARYWDVHTRSPARTVEEDGIEIPLGAGLRTRQGSIEGYTSQAFDLFMQEGKDAALYAAPYRWMLERCDGNSAFANLAFPVLVFHAFGSSNPVGLLQASLDKALKSPVVWQCMERRSRNINLDWLDSWATFIGEAVEPAKRELRLEDFTAGWEVIARGRLGRHPIYRPYLGRVQALFNRMMLNKATPPKERSLESIYDYAIVDLPMRDPRVIFAFPGQPIYRLALGEHLPPPRVRFQGLTLHAERSLGAGVLAKLREQMGETPQDADASLKPVFEAFDPRLKRFREAEYAVSVGLPATTFH